MQCRLDHEEMIRTEYMMVPQKLNIDQISSVVIGKDVLELLSNSMYVDPLVIYREYIQNSTDAIDNAVSEGILSGINDGRVDISVDHIDRRVVIRDNGIGIRNTEFAPRMLSFGASQKRGTDARGFRGVGRLAGLGFAQKLIFRSRAIGDPHIFEAAWDMRTVKQMLASTDNDIEFETIVLEALHFSVIDATNKPPHFFEVELVKPRRIGNDRLLNEVEIQSYIGQICPCPLPPKFKHRAKIKEILAPHGRAGQNYKIHINGAVHPVYRPYGNEIIYSDAKKSRVSKELKRIEIPKSHGSGLAAIGWFVHHDYQGAIPASVGVRGLRARLGNIQIGNERLLAEIFPEERFCSWAIGEVHILDERVLPNGRRDAFEVSIHVDHLIVNLRMIGIEIARECRLASQRRHRSRKMEIGIDKVYEKIGIIRQGAISRNFVDSTKGDIQDLLEDLRTIVSIGMFEKAQQGKYKMQIANLETDLKAAVKNMDNNQLACVPLQKQEIYREVFDLIYACSSSQVVAKDTIDSILAKLSQK